jgi:hypothetical protein
VKPSSAIFLCYNYFVIKYFQLREKHNYRFQIFHFNAYFVHYIIGIIRWPGGNYGLLKPLTGCPTGWDDKGYIFQDTVNTNPSNNRSEILQIDGHVARSEVLRYFCIKTTGTDETLIWPQGTSSGVFDQIE